VPISGTVIETNVLIFAPDGARVVAIGAVGGKRARWFDARTGEEISAGAGKGCPPLEELYIAYPSLAFSPDGQQLAWGGHLRGVAQIWDMATERKWSRLMPRSEGWMHTYSADGKRLIVAGQYEVVEFDVEQGKIIRRFAAEGGSPRAFSPDATRFATLLGGEIQIWDVPSGRKLITLKDQWVSPRCAAFSPGNHRLVTAQGGETLVKVWDLATGNRALSLDDHTKPVWSVTFSPDGRHIATAGEDGRVKVWNSQTGKVEWSFDEESGKVTSVAFSHDGRCLVALNGQARLRIWNTQEWAK
jgi:WD40 repeat protein